MPEKRVLISADGGGTKTEFCLHDLLGGEDTFYTYGSTNYKTVGVETATQNLVHAFLEICEKERVAPPQIQGMVLGLAGYDNEKDVRMFSQMAAALGLPPEKLFLCNDCELAFRATADPPGICTVAGTGSIAFGFDRAGNTTRCGGWGGLLSDGGSGYWIASQVLRRLLAFCDGTDEYEPVFDEVREFYGAKDWQALPLVLTELNITGVAASARTVMDFARNGDAFSAGIVRQAAQLVSQLTLSLYQQLDLANEPDSRFVVSGGMFRDEAFYKHYQGELEEAIGRSATLIHIGERTSQNGIRLARRLFDGALT